MFEIDHFGKKLLCVDDSKTQLEVYKNELGALFSITTALNYTEVIASLSINIPDLIILDMNMPGVSGLEFLDIIKNTPQYKKIPVIIVSSETDPITIKLSFKKGAADYVRKPYDSEELILRINRLFQLLADAPIAQLEAKTCTETAQDLLLQSLINLAKTRDNEGTKHLDRFCLYTEALAQGAANSVRFAHEASELFITNLSKVAAVHDLGKVNIPEYILQKKEELTAREFEYIKRHTTEGARTIDAIRLAFPDYTFLEYAREVIMLHHERWDGTGYPEGRKRTEIPLAARIIAIVDTFDAMCTERVYKKALDFETSFAHILEEKNKAFDPDLVDVFKLIKAQLKDIYDKNHD